MSLIAAVMDRIKGKLVVSCQAAPGDPLEDTDAIRRIARAAVGGGAAGLRVNGFDHIAAIRHDTDLPIIGIKKQYFNGLLRITPDFASAAELATAGADIIALDCTDRMWPIGDPWRQCIERIHRELKLPVMADIATFDEAIAAAAAGADMIGMTLNGYTEETKDSHGFSWPLLASLVRQADRPIIAEGHISTPADAKRAIHEGAWSVVVGSAITRPGTITARFVQTIVPRDASACAVGVDIGGTSVKAGLVDREGCVTFVTRVPTQATEGRDAIAAATAAAIENVLEAARRDGLHPAGLGIASAGAINTSGAVFAATDNLPGWAGFNLRSFAEDRFQLPAYVNNDAHAAVLAELHFGFGRELSEFVALTIGTGVGGGIVSGGKLIRGQYGFAGTVGHHTIRFDGRRCNCGRRGCLEAYVSTIALIQEYENRPSAQQLDLSQEDASLAFRISQLATAGDPAALEAYRTLAGYLAEGVANIFNILDPEAVVLSGGLVEGHTQFAAEVAIRTTSLLHFGRKRAPRVYLSAAGQYAGLQGAAAAVFASDEERLG